MIVIIGNGRYISSCKETEGIVSTSNVHNE